MNVMYVHSHHTTPHRSTPLHITPHYSSYCNHTLPLSWINQLISRREKQQKMKHTTLQRGSGRMLTSLKYNFIFQEYVWMRALKYGNIRGEASAISIHIILFMLHYCNILIFYQEFMSEKQINSVGSQLLHAYPSF